MNGVLYIVADTRLLNPLIDQGIIDEAYRDDAESARSEWGAQWRSDISQYLDDELIDKAVYVGRRSLTCMASETYVAFADPSGGRHDSMVLGIAHCEVGGKAVLDRLVIQKAPFEPAAVVERFCEVLGSYGLRSVTGDAYSAEWVSSAFAKHGVLYEASTLDKSAIYVESMPLFSQGLIELLDVPELTTELRLLERRPRGNGRGDLIDHPRQASDDVANAACGALLAATKIPRINIHARAGQAITDYCPYTWQEDRR